MFSGHKAPQLCSKKMMDNLRIFQNFFFNLSNFNKKGFGGSENMERENLILQLFHDGWVKISNVGLYRYKKRANVLPMIARLCATPVCPEPTR